MSESDRDGTATTIAAGRACLGIELGSTRIKACVVDSEDPSRVLAVGVHDWENDLVDGIWTYSLEAVRSGLQAAYAAAADDAAERYEVRPERFAAIGVSAMMHGYLPFDSDGRLLAPFRTWRNTTTGPAAARLSELFGVNIPLRWSIAHLDQAILDEEEHVPRLAFLTTLAGYVHERLTGRRVLGVGDASGMFPVDPGTGGYDLRLVARYNDLVADRLPGFDLASVLPEVLSAGQAAGELTAEGARYLDPSGGVQPGSPCCPPEGDAGTGMVATSALAPRTGNVSVGTSVFAMVVLERGLAHPHPEIDVVATPAGDPVAMVHCNNGAGEVAAWAGVFREFAAAAGRPMEADEVFRTLFAAAADADASAGGILAYNQLAGEPVAGLEAGRPLVVRGPDDALTLPGLMRAQLYGVFASLALGMKVLDQEDVALDRMFAHGGLFRTPGAPQNALAAALGTPVSVAANASEGGAWGIAVLACYRAAVAAGEQASLADYVADRVFGEAPFDTVRPDPTEARGFAAYLERYTAGLETVRAAARIPAHRHTPREGEGDHGRE